jgi:hypothetical protein
MSNVKKPQQLLTTISKMKINRVNKDKNSPHTIETTQPIKKQGHNKSNCAFEHSQYQE